jgi:hypothetical protein
VKDVVAYRGATPRWIAGAACATTAGCGDGRMRRWLATDFEEVDKKVSCTLDVGYSMYSVRSSYLNVSEVYEEIMRSILLQVFNPKSTCSSKIEKKKKSSVSMVNGMNLHAE